MLKKLKQKFSNIQDKHEALLKPVQITKENLFIHQISLILHIFLLITFHSCHLGTHSSPDNLHSHAPPLSHARVCEENKIFLTFLTPILKLRANPNVITFDMITSFIPAPIIQTHNKRKDEFIYHSS